MKRKDSALGNGSSSGYHPLQFTLHIVCKAKRQRETNVNLSKNFGLFTLSTIFWCSLNDSLTIFFAICVKAGKIKSNVFTRQADNMLICDKTPVSQVHVLSYRCVHFMD